MPQFIETPRLILRMFSNEDWQALCEMFADPECVRYTIKEPLPDWLTWRWLASYLGHWQLRGYGPYAAVQKKSQEVIGPIGLWFPGDWPETEIKWSIARRFWGQGYVTEAAAAVKDVVREELKWQRLISLIHPENSRSIAVAHRLGGAYEKSIPFRGESADIYSYNLV